MKKWLLFLLILFSGCGGGNTDSKPVVSVYNDSASTGDYLKDGQLMHTIDPLAGIAINRSMNGRAVTELVAGGSVAHGFTPTTRSLAEMLQDDPAQIVMVGGGHVDAMYTNETPTEYYNAVVKEVELVVAAGKTPVVRGLNHFAETPFVTKEMLARRDQFNEIDREVAATHYARFCDVGKVSFDGLSDLAYDQLHPNEQYNAKIKPILEECFK